MPVKPEQLGEIKAMTESQRRRLGKRIKRNRAARKAAKKQRQRGRR